MTDYTPSEVELITAAASDNPYGAMEEAEARRAIAKIEADALREAAYQLLRGDWPERYSRPIRGAHRELREVADQIEREAGIEHD